MWSITELVWRGAAQQLRGFSVASVVPVPVPVGGGFPIADHEGCSSEFVENTNNKSLLSVQLTSTLKMVPEQTLRKVLLTGPSVYYSWSPVGGSVSYESEL